MNSGQRAFIRKYFGITTRSLIARRSIHRRAQKVTTFIIDSAALSDGTLRFSRSFSFDNNSIKGQEIAQRVLTHQTTRYATQLRNSLGASSSRSLHNPVDIHTGAIMRSSWHHGSSFQNFWLSDVVTLIHYADLTENERERLIYWSRNAQSEGCVTIAVATSVTNSLPRAKPAMQSLENIHILAFSQALYPQTAYVVERIRQMGIRIVYASSDLFDRTASLARMAGLIPYATALQPLESLSSVKSDVIANLSAKKYAAFIAQFDPSTRLVIDEPLVQFWPTYHELRGETTVVSDNA